jgi:membrane-associated two-gene conflict system component 1 (EACC1)
MTEVRMHVAGYPDSDDEERADLAWRLRQEIQEHGIDEVSHPSLEAPPGSKGGAIDLAQLVVTFAGTLPALIMAVQGWLGRHPRAAVTLEIDGDTLTLDEASPADRQRLMEVFLAKHGGA